ncbi:tetraspanin-9-like [Daphnia pulex]|uniref:tetraspanin-9-like n=1 Tax=Daphnia pulex TaxID=6669 RepID=UPI001EDEF519|nr:tetraspanin-9-like [Daphnia pulex]XP_046654029.1 tetraspanin-9-like [Daphnia pulicaria]XP_046654030.1 tetraspanin-9-like [Daphnia pulicaria]
MGHGAEMNGCGKCLKYLMFTFNLLSLVGGIVVMAVGIWTCVDHAYMEQLLGTNLYMSAAYILIATGVVVILISFLGCLGAVKEIKCMLLTYFIVMFGIFVTMLVGGILGYAFRSNVAVSMRTRMYSSLGEYGVNRVVTDAWDFTQSKLRCCGVEGFDGYRIWRTENRNFNSNSQVPLSCCQKIWTSGQIGSTGLINSGMLNSGQMDMTGQSYMPCQGSPNSNTAYLIGCYEKGLLAVQEQAAIVGGVGIGIAFVTLMGMIFSMALFNMIK